MPRRILYSPPTLFGKFLFQEFTESKLRLHVFAEMFGLGRQDLRRFFQTDCAPSLDILLRISEHTGVNFMMLVVLARPDHASMLVQQMRKRPNAIEDRLVARHLLPVEIDDAVESILSGDIDAVLFDALMTMDDAMYAASRERLDMELRDQLLAIHDRCLARILTILGVKRRAGR